MGDKLDGYRAKLNAMPEDSPLRILGVEIGRAMGTKSTPTTDKGYAALLLELEALKKIVDAALAAINEEYKRRKNQLYEIMLAEETTSFTCKGKTFYQTTETWVKAKDELGGRTNPDLKAWLEEVELGNIVKQDINYQTLQGSVNEWLTRNPIEFVKNGDYLEGQELLDALGLTAEEYETLKAQHARVRELCDIGESHTVGMRKA